MTGDPTTRAVAEAVADGQLPGRVWMYSNYHCNLACTYCLTDSAPGVARRAMSAADMLRIAHEARELGFTSLGVTGGEPFLLPWLPDLLGRLARILPVVALSNGTLFHGDRLAQLRPLAGLPVRIQISLDAADPAVNDAARGRQSHAGAVAAIANLTALGVGVKVATTSEALSEEARGALCALHRALGIPDEDHVVRPILRRGRAAGTGRGIDVRPADLPPELTITVDGAFWSPFGPTVRAGHLDTDLLITRVTRPLAIPARALLRLVAGGVPGPEAGLRIR
jgi:MoaA/NifB/PqqE/SkfB family radical SAM enzyme